MRYVVINIIWILYKNMLLWYRQELLKLAIYLMLYIIINRKELNVINSIKTNNEQIFK